MNQSLAAPIRKANPGTFQSDHEVIRQFVVRNRELDIVMEILRGNARTSSCQHILLVAPRGRGKTMLLARVAAELRVHEDLSRDLLPVRFMEESHEVFDMADFWLECLFHLARESAVRDPKLRSELRDTHRALSAQGRQDELIEPRARTAVLDAVDRLGKKIVLMVENLQDLSGDVDERFGWKLREELQSQPQIMLLATATSRFRGLDDARQPFFELFRILRLDPLDTEECRRLWHVLSGDAVHAREIRPLQILTGGSPRLLVFVADFSRHRSVRQLMEQLVNLIDDHTEYFRSHLEGFAKTERRVYLATVDLWQPSTAGEIGTRSRLDIRTVSTMLGRLVHRGALISEGDGKRRRYSASERLYTVYYKLRRERDEAAVVSNLIRFMVMFYSHPELAGMSETLRMEAARSRAIREGNERPIAEATHSDNNADVVQRYDASDSPELQEQVAKAIVARGITQAQLGDTAAGEAAAYDEIIRRYGASDSPELQVHVATAMVNKGFIQIVRDRESDALRTCEALEGYGSLTDHNDVSFGWWAAWLRTKALLRLGRRTDAVESFRSTYAEFRTAGVTMSKILKLSLELISAGAPERDLLAVVASDPEKAASLAPLVVALRIRRGEEVRAPAQVMEIAEDILKQVDTEL